MAKIILGATRRPIDVCVLAAVPDASVRPLSGRSRRRMGLSPQGASLGKRTRTLRSRRGVVVQRKTSLFRWVTNRMAGSGREDQGSAGGGERPGPAMSSLDFWDDLPSPHQLTTRAPVPSILPRRGSRRSQRSPPTALPRDRSQAARRCLRRPQYKNLPVPARVRSPSPRLICVNFSG